MRLPTPTEKRGWIVYTLFVMAVVSWLGVSVSPFVLLPPVDLLIAVYLLSLLLLLLSLLSAVIRRRWRQALVRVAFVAVVLLPYYVAGGTASLHVAAFRYHASRFDEYLSRCRLIEFVENGTRQRLGRCEAFEMERETYLEVYYDSSGELIVPPSQRSAEWTEAISHFSPHDVLIKKAGRANRIIGDFYEITIFPSELDGDDEDRKLTGFVPAKFLMRNGAYVVDPLPGGSQRAYLYSDATGQNKTAGEIANPNIYLIVPENYSEDKARAFAARISGMINQPDHREREA